MIETQVSTDAHRVLRAVLLALLAAVGGLLLSLLIAGPAAAGTPGAPAVLGEVVDGGTERVADVASDTVKKAPAVVATAAPSDSGDSPAPPRSDVPAAPAPASPATAVGSAEPVVSAATSTAAPVLEPATSVAEPVTGAVGSAAEPVVGTVASVAEPAAETVASAAEPVVGTIASVAEPAVETVVSVVEPAVGTVASVTEPVIANLPSVADPTAGAIASVTEPALGTVVSVALPVVATATSNAEPVIGPVVEPVIGPVVSAPPLAPILQSVADTGVHVVEAASAQTAPVTEVVRSVRAGAGDVPAGLVLPEAVPSPELVIESVSPTAAAAVETVAVAPIDGHTGPLATLAVPAGSTVSPPTASAQHARSNAALPGDLDLTPGSPLPSSLSAAVPPASASGAGAFLGALAATLDPSRALTFLSVVSSLPGSDDPPAAPTFESDTTPD